MSSLPSKIAPVSRGPITLGMLKAYAQASGDHNPIHTDEAAAKKAGLPGVIAHGMLSAGFLADRAVRFMEEQAALGHSSWTLRSFGFRFKAMTFLDDVIAVSGVVKEAGPGVIHLELSAMNQKGETTTQGRAEYRQSGDLTQ